MQNFQDHFPTPERMAEIEANAKRAQPSDEDWIPPIDDEDEQPEPPDRGAPPPGDDPDATAIGDRRVHPAASIFPEMPESEFEKHLADVKANGQLVPILISPDGMLIDGRARARACLKLGIEPVTEVRNGDPMKIVISANRHRKHLTPMMLVWSALDLVQTSHGDAARFRPKPAQPIDSAQCGIIQPWEKPQMTQAEVADFVGTNIDQIRTGAAIKKMKLRPGIVAAFLDGRIKTVYQAKLIVTPTRDEARDGLTSDAKQRAWLADPSNIQFKRQPKPPGPMREITARTLKALSELEAAAIMAELEAKANRALRREGKQWRLVPI